MKPIGHSPMLQLHSVIFCALTTRVGFYIKILPSTCSFKITILPAVITSAISSCHAVGRVKDYHFCSFGNVHLDVLQKEITCPQIDAAAVVTVCHIQV